MSVVQDLRTVLTAGGIPSADIEAFIARLTPSRRLHEKDLSGPCYVYVLINPSNKRPIYIGISRNPWSRFASHCHDPASAAWPALKTMMGSGLFHRDEILKIYKKCSDRNEALALEHRLITTTPKLLNRDKRRYQMWNYAA